MTYDWNQLIENNKGIIGINGIIEKIIPLENKNQVIVINKVIVINQLLLYAVRLIEYDPETQELFELIKSPRITFARGHSWEKALEKANQIEKLSNEELELLRKKSKSYGVCKECNKPKVNKDDWCQSCNAKHFQDNFPNWTSGNEVIDEFIKRHQKLASDQWEILEWIPYEHFKIEKDEKGNDIVIGKGGFSEVYKAKWTEGPIKKWSLKNNKWKRDNNKYVALKVLNNYSEVVEEDFLKEIANHGLVNGEDGVVRCFGISQDPITKNYIMVMEYIENGNLRDYLNKELDLKDKLEILNNIARGLNSIHKKGLIHKHLNSWNILVGNNNECYISDLGLCQPANYQKEEGKIYGVLPYVAPEVLKGQPYTQASDIYSWAIIATEVVSGSLPYQDTPYSDWDNDEELRNKLAVKIICQGLRPDLDSVIAPQLWKDLIRKCWDIDPTKRPTAQELKKISSEWFMEVTTNIAKENFPLLSKVYFTLNKESKESLKNTEFWQQYKNAEESYKYLFNKNSSRSLLIEIKELEEQLKQLEKQKAQLIKRNSDLEILIEESQQLIKLEKEKLIQTYLFFDEEEKKSLEKLRSAHKEYNEAKKFKKEDANKLFKQVSTLRQQIEDKRGENFMQIVETVLTNFEELYENEWRLQQQLEQKELVSEKKEEITITKRLITKSIEDIKEINKNIKLLQEKPHLIINKHFAIGDISVNQGNLLIDNVIGDSANLSYNTNAYTTKLEEITDELLTTHIEQPSK